MVIGFNVSLVVISPLTFRYAFLNGRKECGYSWFTTSAHDQHLFCFDCSLNPEEEGVGDYCFSSITVYY